MNVYVCVSVYVYSCLCVCVFMYVCMGLCVWVYVCKYMFACVYVCVFHRKLVKRRDPGHESFCSNDQNLLAV